MVAEARRRRRRWILKAWQFHSIEDWRLDDVPEPKPGRGEVLIKVRVVQPSVTEVVASRLGATHMSGRVKQIIEERAPIRLFGHEYAGDVVAVGPGVKQFKVGDRVASINPHVACGECSDCRSGREHVCRKGRNVGREIPGCFAEYAAIPEPAVVRIPDGIGYNVGAAFQPEDTCFGVVLTAGIKGGETVAILGQGVIGTGVMQLARAKGAGRVIVADIRKENLELTRRLGAHDVIDASRTDPVRAIMDLTNGNGVDVAVDAAGGDPQNGLAGHDTLLQAVKVVKQEGMVIQPAIVSGLLDIDLALLREKRLHLAWPRSLTRPEMEELVGLIAKGTLQLQPAITHVVKGLDKVPQAFAITGEKFKHQAINPCQVEVA